MATSMHHLSDYDASTVPSAEGLSVGIVVADWNDKYTYSMLEAAQRTLMAHGINENDILIKHVPGSFELIYGCKWMLSHNAVDAVIAIGCVIRGDTPHFDYICQGTTQGLTELNLSGDKPVIFGLLTCNTAEQAEARCGGVLGNKGDECAIAAIKMASIGKI